MREHPDYALAVPTLDHFIPLLYTAGLAEDEGRAAAIARGYALGSQSMTCYGLGRKSADCATGNDAAGLPAGVPADQTNI